MKIDDISYLIIDWGTTNFRAFAINEQGETVSDKELSLGLLNVTQGKFAQELEIVLASWLDNYKALPIYMAGMVGSIKGWVNVEYASTPCSKTDLVNRAHKFTTPWNAQAVILPGVSHQYEGDKYDVMRGEEIQLFGLNALLQTSEHNTESFFAVMPGTHSKHVKFTNKIHQFSSYMTGEIFSLLSKHSLLATRQKRETFDKQVFIDGVNDAQQGEFTNRVFLAWTNRVFKKYQEVQMEDYLSGLLIGFELRNIDANQFYLIGGKQLCERYQVAAQQLGKKCQYYSGNECFLAGMKELIQELQNEL